MGWRDTLRPASFRGVEFLIDSTEKSGGRRAVRHDFPQKDFPFFEDLGRKAREFSFEGYVIGEDYNLQRNLLEGALELPGPGQLIHPYRGNKLCICTEFRVRESSKEGGLARFTFTFVETGLVPQFPASAGADLVEDAADNASDTAGGWFATVMNVIGYAQHVIDAAKAIVADLKAKLDAVLGPIKAAVEAVAELKRALDDFILDLDALIRAPFELAAKIKSLFKSFANLPALPSRKVSALLDAYGLVSGDPNIPPGTPARDQQQANQDALLALIRVTALSEACKLAPSIAFSSYEEALAMRETLTGFLDAEMEAATDDNVFSSLQALRVEVVRSIPGTDNDLARLITYTPPVDLPSLVIAQELYGDAARAEEIVARNKIPRPAFVPGGQALEVLSNG